MKIILRPYQGKEDCVRFSQLFYDTVHTVNCQDYTEAQRNAWADGKPDLERWHQTFQTDHTVIAEVDGVFAGLGNMSRTGYLDCLYVHKDYQRQGIASAICEELERRSDAAVLWVHASITAAPFFQGRGYRIVKKQFAQRHGVALLQYRMEYVRKKSPEKQR